MHHQLQTKELQIVSGRTCTQNLVSGQGPGSGTIADTTRQILYLADPMCSWCWGFSPVIGRIRQEYSARAPVNLVLGGLRVGLAPPMSPEMKKTVAAHWVEVNKATGQEFCFDFNVPEGFVYDTEAACRAAATVRVLQPEATFPYFDRLHRAFYIENKDLTDPAILAALAGEFGIAPDVFDICFNAQETKRATFDDFSLAFNLGIRGFPAVAFKQGEEYAVLNIGYQPFDELKPLIDTWIDREPA